MFPLTLVSRFWMMPALILKKMVMGNFERGFVDADIADSVDFLVDKVGHACCDVVNHMKMP